MRQIHNNIRFSSGVVWLILLAFSFGGCSASKSVKNEEKTLTGVVMMVGNQPFARLALRTGEGKVYLLNCAGDVERLLYSNQGKIAEVYYADFSNEEPSEIKVIRAVIRTK